MSLTNGARLLSFVGDDAPLEEWAGQLATVATERGFVLWRATATMFRGWVSVSNGEVIEGIALLRSGSAAYRATGAEAWVPYQIALLARACEIAGQIEEGVDLLDNALQIVERTGERWLEAELYRHKGQLLLRQGNSKAAEELYRKALSIAVEQEAKLWELRAAASLARLRRNQGRRLEARDLLTPVYRWFTEAWTRPISRRRRRCWTNWRRRWRLPAPRAGFALLGRIRTPKGRARAPARLSASLRQFRPQLPFGPTGGLRASISSSRHRSHISRWSFARHAHRPRGRPPSDAFNPIARRIACHLTSA